MIVAQNSENGIIKRRLINVVRARIFLSALLIFSSDAGTPCNAACLMRLLDFRLLMKMTGIKVIAIRPAVLVNSRAVDAFKTLAKSVINGAPSLLGVE
jgi:hypothetical protein